LRPLFVGHNDQVLLAKLHCRLITSVQLCGLYIVTLFLALLNQCDLAKTIMYSDEYTKHSLCYV